MAPTVTGTPPNRVARPCILLCGAAGEARRALELLMRQDGYPVAVADDAAAAIERLGREPVGLVLIVAGTAQDAETLVRGLRAGDAAVPLLLHTPGPGARPPRALLRALDVQGHHESPDGPERLLLSVDAIVAAATRLAGIRGADRVKTAMLAEVSHELRTPLNVIMGYLELVREGAFGEVPPPALDILAKVAVNADHLLELVQELLDLSKAEATGPSTRCIPVRVPDVMRPLVEAATLLVAGRPVTVRAEIAATAPPVLAEPAKLRVIVQNLLSNATKFTERGTITVTVDDAPAGRVALRVADTGPGIPPESQEAVFEPFRQLGSEDDRRKGAGLGLALARRFARVMGGELSVASTPGHGTTFTLVLRRADGAARDPAASRAA